MSTILQGFETHEPILAIFIGAGHHIHGHGGNHLRHFPTNKRTGDPLFTVAAVVDSNEKILTKFKDEFGRLPFFREDTVFTTEGEGEASLEDLCKQFPDAVIFVFVPPKQQIPTILRVMDTDGGNRKRHFFTESLAARRVSLTKVRGVFNRAATTNSHIHMCLPRARSDLTLCAVTLISEIIAKQDREISDIESSRPGSDIGDDARLRRKQRGVEKINFTIQSKRPKSKTWRRHTRLDERHVLSLLLLLRRFSQEIGKPAHMTVRPNRDPHGIVGDASLERDSTDGRTIPPHITLLPAETKDERRRNQTFGYNGDVTFRDGSGFLFGMNGSLHDKETSQTVTITMKNGDRIVIDYSERTLFHLNKAGEILEKHVVQKPSNVRRFQGTTEEFHRRITTNEEDSYFGLENLRDMTECAVTIINAPRTQPVVWEWEEPKKLPS